MLKGLIEGVIGAVIGVALLPVLTSAIATANVTGTAGSLLNIVPTLYVIVIVVGVVAYIYVQNK
jgi:uncharacterized membrane protein